MTSERRDFTRIIPALSIAMSVPAAMAIPTSAVTEKYDYKTETPISAFNQYTYLP